MLYEVITILLRDVTAQTGITFRHTDGASGRRYIMESMKSSSWVRAMFETGIRLKAKHGAQNVFA